MCSTGKNIPSFRVNDRRSILSFESGPTHSFGIIRSFILSIVFRSIYAYIYVYKRERERERDHHGESFEILLAIYQRFEAGNTKEGKYICRVERVGPWGIKVFKLDLIASGIFL